MFFAYFHQSMFDWRQPCNLKSLSFFIYFYKNKANGRQQYDLMVPCFLFSFTILRLTGVNHIIQWSYVFFLLSSKHG